MLYIFDTVCQEKSFDLIEHNVQTATIAETCEAKAQFTSEPAVGQLEWASRTKWHQHSEDQWSINTTAWQQRAIKLQQDQMELNDGHLDDGASLEKKTIGSHLMTGRVSCSSRSKVPEPHGRAAAASSAGLKVKLTRGLSERLAEGLAATWLHSGGKSRGLMNELICLCWALPHSSETNPQLSGVRKVGRVLWGRFNQQTSAAWWLSQESQKKTDLVGSFGLILFHDIFGVFVEFLRIIYSTYSQSALYF